MDFLFKKKENRSSYEIKIDKVQSPKQKRNKKDKLVECIKNKSEESPTPSTKPPNYEEIWDEYTRTEQHQNFLKLLEAEAKRNEKYDREIQEIVDMVVESIKMRKSKLRSLSQTYGQEHCHNVTRQSEE